MARFATILSHRGETILFGDKLSRFRREFSEGEILFEEDDWGKFLIVVDEGSIQIEKNLDGSPQIVAEIGSGGMVGEMVLAGDDHRRTATARAATQLTGWKFNEKQIEELIHKNETFRNKLFSTLTGRLQRTTDNVAELLELKDRQIRIILLLASLLEEDQFLENEPLEANVNLTPEFLAERYGTSFEVFQSIFENHAGGERGDVELDDLRKHRDVAERVLEQFMQKLDINVPWMLNKSPGVRGDLIETLRTVNESLEAIEDPDKQFSRNRFKQLRKDRAEMEELFDEYRDLETSEQMTEKIQKTLNAVDYQLKQFAPDDFED